MEGSVGTTSPAGSSQTNSTPASDSAAPASNPLDANRDKYVKLVKKTEAARNDEPAPEPKKKPAPKKEPAKQAKAPEPEPEPEPEQSEPEPPEPPEPPPGRPEPKGDERKAHLAKQARAIKRHEAELAARQRELQEREAQLRSQYEERLKAFETNPLAALKAEYDRRGLSLTEALKRELQGQPAQPQQQPQDPVQAELAALKKQLQQQQIGQLQDRLHKAVSEELVKAPIDEAKYPNLFEYNDSWIADTVSQTMLRAYLKHGERLTPEQAYARVEAVLAERASELSRVRRQRMQPKSADTAPAPEPAAQKRAQDVSGRARAGSNVTSPEQAKRLKYVSMVRKG